MALSPVFIQSMISFLHNMFTAMWIGGMLTLALAVMPAVKKVFGKSKETHAFNTLFKKKLSLLTYISLVGLIITGLLMGKKATTLGVYTGFLSFGTPYSTLLSIKHLLYFVMFALAIFRSLILDKLKNMTHEQKMKLSIITLILNIIAGLTVLFLSSYIGILATLPKP